MLKGKVNFNLDALERLFKTKTPPLDRVATSVRLSVKLVEIADAGKNVYRVERYCDRALAARRRGRRQYQQSRGGERLP